MAENKQFPTPKMLEAREKWAKKSPAEKKAIEDAFQERLRRYYANRPSREMIMASMGEDDSE